MTSSAADEVPATACDTVSAESVNKPIASVLPETPEGTPVTTGTDA